MHARFTLAAIVVAASMACAPDPAPEPEALAAAGFAPAANTTPSPPPYDRSTFDGLCGNPFFLNDSHSDALQDYSALPDGALDTLSERGASAERKWGPSLLAADVVASVSSYADLYELCLKSQDTYADPQAQAVLDEHRETATNARELATRVQDMIRAAEVADPCLSINRAGQVWNQERMRLEAAPSHCPSFEELEQTAGR